MVVVEEARAHVEPWRRRYAPDVIVGALPPHITILYPFVRADIVGAELLDELRTLYASFAPFSFDLVSVEDVAAAVRRGISSSLPIPCRATAVTLLEQEPGGTWGDRERLLFAAS